MEVLLQRTKAETVATFFPEFLRRYPTWISLSRASETELQEFLKPIGLWRQRASALSRLSHEMAKRRGRFSRDITTTERLPGVGQYVANAILMFAYGESEPLLDTNMARVLERYFGPRKLADIRDDPYLQALARQILGRNPALVNWAVLDFGAAVCKLKNTECPTCPLKLSCSFWQATQVVDATQT